MGDSGIRSVPFSQWPEAGGYLDSAKCLKTL